MLICAGGKLLIVAIEMVNYYGVFEKDLDRAGTADKTDRGNHQRYRGALHSCCHSAPVYPHNAADVAAQLGCEFKKISSARGAQPTPPIAQCSGGGGLPPSLQMQAEVLELDVYFLMTPCHPRR